jgi:tetratricopeptide (TPR) repeat protein
MTAQNNLDLEGNFQTHPFAELLVEIREARLDGSLRLSRENQKVIVYFNAGEIVFAVSNARSARLFDILLRENKIDKKLLAESSNYASDFEFAKFLIEKQVFGKQEIDRLFVGQIEDILRDTLGWETGEWNFSPLVRIKQGICFQIGLSKILVGYSRGLSGDTVFQRFRSMQEVFIAKETTDLDINLQPHEAFVLSRFNDSQLSVDEVKNTGALPTTSALQTLYTLWLGGFLIRRGWNSAFTAHRLEAISSARLALKKGTAETATPSKPGSIMPPTAPQIIEDKEEINPAEEKIRLEIYLDRVEKSRNFYESLNVETKVGIAEIKKSYFALAKQFHPDHFHKEADADLLRRIQKAFSAIAKAYDTLKNEDSRSSYDFKIRNELPQMQSFQKTGAGETDKRKQSDVAEENFDQGVKLLLDENYAEALPFLARAVHFAPDVARYHAYYGKVLATNETQRFKAETELQTAVKLDPKNPLFRITLAEFFIDYNLLKRAEGELKRFLTVVPNNPEVQALLDSLQKK